MPSKAVGYVTVDVGPITRALTEAGIIKRDFGKSQMPRRYFCIRLNTIQRNTSDMHIDARAVDSRGNTHFFDLVADGAGTYCPANNGKLMRLDDGYYLIIEITDG